MRKVLNEKRQKLLDRLAKIEDNLLIYWDDYGVPFGESCVLTSDRIYTLSCMFDYAGPFFFTTRDYNTAKKRLEKGLDWGKEVGDGDGEFAKVIDLVKAGCLPKTECYQFQSDLDNEPVYYQNEDDVRDAFASEVMAFGQFRLWEELSITELRDYCKWADHLEYETPLTLVIKT
jgi:hypothetical protein